MNPKRPHRAADPARAPKRARGVSGARPPRARRTPPAQAFFEIAESAPVMVWQVDPAGAILYLNSAFREFTGALAERSVGRALAAILHPEDHAGFVATYGAAFVARQPFKIEARFRRADGEYRWLLCTGHPWGSRGAFHGYIGTGLDITARRRNEQALRDSAGRYRDLAESIGDVFFALDAELRCTYWNRACEQMTGVAATDAIGSPYEEVFPLLRDPAVASLLRRVAADAIPGSVNLEARRDGREVSLEVLGYPAAEGLTVIAKDITARRIAEAALQNSEANYRTIFRGANDPILIFEPRSEIVLEANPRACDVYGFAHEELVGLSLKSLTLDVPRGERQIRATLESGRYDDFETVHRRKDGTPVRFVVNASRIDFQGQPAILSVNRIVPDPGRQGVPASAEALRQSEERYRDFVARSSEGIWRCELREPLDAELRPPGSAARLCDAAVLAECNAAFARMLGFESPLAVIGRPLRDVIDPSHPEVRSLLEDFAASGYRVTDREIATRAADGRVRYLLTSLVGTVEGGRLVRVWGNHTDITSRRETERQLRLLAQTITCTKDCISITDLEDRILFVNDAFLSAYGYEEEELLGENVALVRAPSVSQEFARQILPASIAGGWYGELPQRRKDGTEFVAELWTSVVKNDEGQPVALVGVAHDISERKRTEERLKASLREKEVLLKEIHHRVKNNLQVISSLLSLQSEYIGDPAMLRIFRESQNRERSMALIHEKLYQSTNLAAVDFGGYIRDLTGQLFRSYDVSGRRVALEIRADEVSLGIDRAIPCGIILNELVSNALKYAFPGDRRGTIGIDLHSAEDGTVIMVVSDDGVGISPEVGLEQTETLGLKLVNMLTQQLQGTIRLDRSTAGTMFTLTFQN